jgi:hypothetical protein
MTIEAHSKGSFQWIETARDLQLYQDMEDRSQFLDKDNMFATLDDETIVRRFARGKKRLVSNHNLQIEYAHNSLQLSTANGDLIAIHKIAERLHYILVKKDDEYADLIHSLIIEHQFIPIDNTTTIGRVSPLENRRFVRYQKYEIPDGYVLKYEPGEELLQTWQEDRPQVTLGMRLDLLILSKSKWYRVQEIASLGDRLNVETRLGTISVSRQDPIAWIAKLNEISPNDNPRSMQVTVDGQNMNNPTNDSDILAKIISKLSLDSTSTEEEVHFDIETIVSTPFIPETPESSLLYDPDRSSVLMNNNSSFAIEGLTNAAIRVLEDYLENGETIVRTEIITDAQGNTIGEKNVTTQRGCPKWAIEAVLKWE